MSQQQRQPANAPILNIFSVMSNWLHAEPVEGAQKRPNIRFQVLGNVPRIVVRTNLPNDINYGRIEFKTDLATFTAAMHYAQKLADNAPDVPQERRFVYQDDFLAGKRLDKTMVISQLVIGRDAQTSRLYMAIVSSQQQRPRIRFYFGPSKYHDILNEEGQSITPKEMSEMYAIGFLKPAYDLTTQLLMQDFDPNGRNVANPANFTNNTGGGQQSQQGGFNGGGQQRQQQSGGYSAPAAAGFDADIPDFI